jgi:hypothetical protein
MGQVLAFPSRQCRVEPPVDEVADLYASDLVAHVVGYLQRVEDRVDRCDRSGGRGAWVLQLCAVSADLDSVLVNMRIGISDRPTMSEMKKHWERLAPVLDLKALAALSDGDTNREVPEG